MTQTPGSEQLPILSARDLKGFERNRVYLIREMEEAGWRGRRGAKMHVIMRSPDGETTTAISRRVISKDDQFNVERDFRRWQRQQERQQQQEAAALAELAEIRATSEPVLPEGPFARQLAEPAPEPVEPVDMADTAEDTATSDLPPGLPCPECGRVFGTRQALSVHHVRAHVRVTCEICDRELSPSNLGRHLRAHEAHLGTYAQVMREVLETRRTIKRLTAEVATWQGLAETAEAQYADLQAGLRALTEG